MSGGGVGKVVDVQLGRAGQKEQEGKDMVVVCCGVLWSVVWCGAKCGLVVWCSAGRKAGTH